VLLPFFASAQTLPRNPAPPPPAVHSQPRKEPVDYVNPNIGGIGHLLTSVSPDVQRPHGMVQISPIVGPGVTDVYLAGKIYGFSAANLNLIPTIGSPARDPSDVASEIDHDKEVVTPYFSSYLLEQSGVRVSYTVASQAAYFHFEFPGGLPAQFLFSSAGKIQFTELSHSSFQAIQEISGVRSYIYAEFSRPLLSHTISEFTRTVDGVPDSKEQATALLFSGDSRRGAIELRLGFSYIDLDQARRNLQEQTPAWNFTAAKEAARSDWNNALGRILIKGGTADQKTVFYTALYRVFQYMKDITEDDRYFGPYDHAVHPAENHHFYIEDNLWDTYRTRHPLQTIIEPERQNDLLRSYVRMYEESGWMPHFPYMSGDLAYMIGNHAASLFADSYFKGFRDFDLDKAYAGIRKNALEATMLPDRRGGLSELERFYFEKGYFPALSKGEKEFVPEVNPVMRRQAVSVTLENSYDDWNIAELAKALGKSDDVQYFSKRAVNYKNVFNFETGYMAPRASDGSFIKDFNPKWSGGQAGRDYYTECNGLVYTFQVQHDVAGLIALIGGREKFLDRLDALFNDGYDGQLKFVFLAQFPDSTGLMGQYPQGNEPAFHIPYLYDYAGQPWKTQKRVRDIMRVWFLAQPLGIPGDDDNGATSAWFVLSAMGFYPVSPGRPVYDIGSPIFDEVRINVGHGKWFTIRAKNVSALNKYIQSAQLNARPLNKPWFTHQDLSQGGVLEFQMGSEPNKKWGSSPDAVGPSFSAGEIDPTGDFPHDTSSQPSRHSAN
jgi:predicted alpha-1,2-mannosidase